MDSFAKHFKRDSRGWTCMSQASLDLPTGRIQVAPGTHFTRGTDFMGVDVAKILDEHTTEVRWIGSP